MEPSAWRLQSASVAFRRHIKRSLPVQSRRSMASHVEPEGEVRAAPPIRFTSHPDQFSRAHPRAEAADQEVASYQSRRYGSDHRRQSGHDSSLLQRVRIVPASPSYFTATPQYTDDLLRLASVLRKYQLLPRVAPGSAPRVAWKKLDQYKIETAEPIRVKAFSMLTGLLRRLNHIHPAVMPAEVTRTLDHFKKAVQPHLQQAKPIVVNEFGVARAVGRRKSSHAQVQLVEGTGECRVNGRTVVDYFGRPHDRERALWALKTTQRLDKYNVWVVVKGGGTTGQAAAITLGVAKALMAHEPDLKPALRNAGVVTRDHRRVERKKPGKLKARKMPAWVKR